MKNKRDNERFKVSRPVNLRSEIARIQSKGIGGLLDTECKADVEMHLTVYRPLAPAGFEVVARFNLPLTSSRTGKQFLQDALDGSGSLSFMVPEGTILDLDIYEEVPEPA